MKTLISLLIIAIFSLQADETTRDSNVQVIDSLMWQDEPYTNFEKQARHNHKNYEKAQTWKSAISYCEKLTLAGYSDWRLPSKNEMKTIVDKTRRPSIKKEFKNVVGTFYWSSTTHERIHEEAWLIRFSNGSSNYTYKVRSNLVRCVREI